MPRRSASFVSSTPARRRYRWTILSAGVFAQAAFSAILLGLPAIAPRDPGSLRAHPDPGRRRAGRDQLRLACDDAALGNRRRRDRRARRDRRRTDGDGCGTGVGGLRVVVRRARRRARRRRCARRRRQRSERARGHGVVRRRGARTRTRHPSDGHAARRSGRSCRTSRARAADQPARSVLRVGRGLLRRGDRRRNPVKRRAG